MLRQRFKDRVPLYGTFVFSSDPAMTEIAGAAGFDFVIVDREHTSLGWPEILGHARAASAARIPMLVRLTKADPHEAMHALDLGAAGVVVPHFGLDVAATQETARAMRYNPGGNRGTCTGIRANAYGLGDFAEVAARADRDSVFMVQVEDAEVLDGLDDLLATIPVDGVLPGIADLSTSMGLPGQFGNPVVIAAVEKLMAIARGRDVPIGAYVANPGQVKTWLGGAASFFVYSIDYKVVSEGYRTARRLLAGQDGTPHLI
jgi:2-keto-3-deoxy-L-rhamnonate aldolase RhmA